MNILILDGHPDQARLVTHLLDVYAAALPPGHSVERIAVRDLDFTPNLQHGYKLRTPWEADVERVARAIDACDHLVVGFPMWWGAEPAMLKGLLDRVLLPGFAFRYHDADPWWDRLLAGRSADVVITMDTPPLYLRFAWGNPVIKRWRIQVLEFCGFKPLRFFPLGMVKQGGAERKLARWEAQLARAARMLPARRGARQSALAEFLSGGAA
jgi:putative NADPH-quinone reductase